ncbi:MAG TPA: helix-turn-helix domain-containing protein [Ktedonobacterales bacterium]
MQSDSSSWPASHAPADFREALKRHRLAAGLSQAELAERAGLSPRGVSDLERGARTNPRPATVRLLADALNLISSDRATFLAAAHGMALVIPHTGPATEPQSGSPLATTPPSPSPPISPPTGTVTFLFTDIEGSTQLLQRLGDPYADVLASHQRLLREAFAAHGGYEVDTQGDAFFVSFPTAPQAISAAIQATQALAAHPWPSGVTLRVRMGLHSGAPQLVGGQYIGLDVHRAARIAAAGHGGQMLLSAATAELVRHDLPDGVSLRDLGRHRLKDLQQAEQVYQAIAPGLPNEFPMLRALDAHLHNLPVQPSALVGREREVAAVRGLLSRDDVRLVTLTGAGGIGKTRLSLQAAAEVLDAFPDGVWNTRLSRLTDPALLLPTVAQVFDLKALGATPLGDVLRTYLRDKRLLLVLDNFEQIVAAAPEVADLLSACPGVKALVTSRVPLHLRGEHEYTLRPLALPDPAHLPSLASLSQYAAVTLFIERAQQSMADFQVTNTTASAVAEICARLDGLPLAIELAAARVKLLPPPALLKRLERSLPLLTGGARDLEERQQTMRATLAWSYELLSPEEQRLFRRLAVFVGGCTLEAAEAVCIAPVGVESLRLDILDGLSRLVDHNLVQTREDEAGEARFGMLYVIREFALEQLEASGEEPKLHQAHAAYCLTLALQAEPHLNGRQARLWLDRLEREHDNLRAALGWSQGSGATTLAVHLAASLKEYWYWRGRIGEGLTWLLSTLSDSQNGPSTTDVPLDEMIRVKALSAAGVCALWHANYPLASDLLGSCATLAKTMGNIGVAVEALHRLSLATFFQGDKALALGIMEESIAQARKQADLGVQASALCNQGYLYYHLGALDRSAASLGESLTLARQAGDLHLQTINLMALGQVVRRQRESSRARSLLREALDLAREVGDPRLIAETVEYLANIAAERGSGTRAARLLGVAAKLREPIGFPQVPVDQAETEALVAPAREAMGEVAWAAAFAAGRALSLEDAIAEALGEVGVIG